MSRNTKGISFGNLDVKKTQNVRAMSVEDTILEQSGVYYCQTVKLTDAQIVKRIVEGEHFDRYLKNLKYKGVASMPLDRKREVYLNNKKDFENYVVSYVTRKQKEEEDKNKKEIEEGKKKKEDEERLKREEEQKKAQIIVLPTLNKSAWDDDDE
jgi:hypothetical protein